ncbi:MAG TPA: DUF2336 domain-containing protein [Alphaproteobacteria bacterium]
MTEQLVLADPSSIDFQALVRLAATRSEQGRTAVFQTISEFLVEDDWLHSDRERNLASDILRNLLGEVEVKLRLELACRLASRNDMPEALIADLASEPIEVAEIVLRQSPVLSDQTLIEIIRERTEEHQLAIAQRRSLSTPVSGALIETDNDRVVTAVIENTGAQLTESMLRELVEDSRANETYQLALARRKDLPESLARKLCAWVAAPLRERICQRYHIDPAVLDAEIAAAVDTAASAPAADLRRPSRARLIVETLAAKGSLDLRFLQGALFRGSVDVFVEGLALLAGVDPRLVERALADDGPRTLAVVCKLASADHACFESLYRMSRGRNSLQARSSHAERVRAQAAYQAVTVDQARKLADAWSAGKHAEPAG